MDDEIRALSSAIVGEIFLALGFSKTGLAFRTFGRFFQKAAMRLSTISLTADRLIASQDFSRASDWLLTNFCTPIVSTGRATVPPTGPLIVLSNHAGTYDSFIITSQLGRNDLKIIVSDVPFLKHLPNASQHLLFLSEDTGHRSAIARAAIQHLKEGGSLLVYGTGLIDPDPTVYPDADKWIERWLPSVDLFLRAVPQSQVLLTIVSGVVSPRWARHPITWLKRIDWQKRRLAEFSQVIQQLFRPGSFYLSPRLSFSPPYTYTDLAASDPSGRVLSEVISRGKLHLAQHCAHFGGCVSPPQE